MLDDAPSVGPLRGQTTIALAGTGLAALVAFVLYLRTLAPGLVAGDSGELATVAVQGGLAHPPGYPTFTILGHLFTLLPVGDPAFRVNLLSAVAGALAVFAAGVIAWQLVRAAERAECEAAGIGISDGRLPRMVAVLAAAGSALLLAISTAFWRYSLVAEVFALSDLLALAVLGLMLAWVRKPERMRLLWAAALASGLALTNQQTIVFAAPALLILLGLGLERYTAGERVAPPARGRREPVRTGRPMPWRALGIAVGLGVVGLLPYLYLPIAAAGGAPTVWADPRSIGGFLATVLRSAYGTLSFTVRDTSGSPLEHVGLFIGYLVGAFTPVGIAVAVVGSAWLAVRRTWEATALGAWFLLTGPVFLAIANPPLDDPVTRGVIERFYLLPSLVIPLTIAVGAWRIVAFAHARVAATTRTQVSAARVAIAIAALLAVSPLAVAMVRVPEVDASSNHVAEAFARDILEPLPQGALLLMRGDEHYSTIVYAQEVEHVRPDVVALDTELLKLPSYVSLTRRLHPEIPIPWDSYDGGRAALIGNLIDLQLGARPVFTVGPMEEKLTDRFDLLDRGLATEVLKRGTAPDHLGALRDDPAIFDRLHPPARSYPETTWEGAIAATYADLAFRIGVALQQLAPQANAATVEKYYRAAIALDPSLSSAYKNLGLLLQANLGSATEIVALWERFLQLQPDDPEAGAIRAAIERLKGQTGPSPSP